MVSTVAIRLQGVWNGLPANLRGALWLTIGTLFFAVNDAFVKVLGESLHPIQMGFFRYVIGFVLLSPMFIRAGWGGLRTDRHALHAVRAICGVIGQVGVYYAVVHLLLADATAIAFSRPLFVTLLAILMLGEAVGWRRWAATLVGFTGVLIMIRPGHGELDPAWMVALGSSFLLGLGMILIRRLAMTEPANRILFHYHVWGIAMFVGPAIWVWQTPVGTEWLFLLLIGVLTTAAMFCVVHALVVGEASIVGPMEYIRLVYAALIGYFLFAELPSNWTWVGAAFIIGSAIYIARREATAAPPGGG